MENILAINIFILLIFLLLNIKAYQIASFLKLFDQPNNRKIHDQKIPLIGGLLIWFSTGLSILANFFIFDLEIEHINFYLLSSLFFIVGLIDDRYSLNATLRLLFLFCSSLVIYEILNIQKIEFILINEFGLFHIYYGSIIISVFCILLFQNSMNMIDGINGLSGSIFLGMLFFLLLVDQTFNNFILIQLIFYLIIFLYFNLKNKIFMGDAGVYFLSSFIGVYIIHLSQHQSNLTINSIFLLMILPGIDMFRVFIERVLNKKSPFVADKNHIHHILIRNYSQKITLTIVIFLSFFPIFAYELLNINFFIIIIIFFIIYFLLISKIKK